MKVIGGSFGVPGTANVTDNDTLFVRATEESDIHPTEIEDARAEVDVKFSFLTFLTIFALTIIIILVAGTGFVSWAVGIIGLVGCVAGSFRQRNVVELSISENRSITLECNSTEVRRIYDLQPLAKK